jgi:cytoskeletal protein CcmA (bactofilin family)
MKGDLRASEDLTVEGRLEGRIDLPDHTLTIGPNANVKAHIAARIVTVFGTVVGVVTAQEKIDVRSGASVEGEITCARIAIQDGAVVTGKVAMSGRASKPNGAATATSVPALAAVG